MRLILLGCVLLTALLFVSPLTNANGTPIPFPNNGFEKWDANTNKPEGWWVGGAGYEATADCSPEIKVPEGQCALRLRSTPTAKADGFIPLSQAISPASAAGHRLKLSGYIRTESLENGWAGLWLRIGVPGRLLAFDNMQMRGPRGTTDWQRFEIALPVAPNSAQIVFGVLMTGKGTAWFDDLTLDVDKSVNVPKADIPQEPALQRPPRPQIPSGLLDEKALAIPTDDIPKANGAWRDDVKKRHHAIRSLSSDDFSDLQFLKPLLKDKRVVQLGESSHGVAEFNWLKVRLIKFLHREMGYDLVAFESSLTGCDGADRMIGAAAPADVMRECIFGVWHTEEVLPLFDWLDATRKSGRRVTLAGFDTQNSGTGSRHISERFKAMLDSTKPELAGKIDANHQRLKRGLATAEAKELTDFYSDVAAELKANRASLLKKYASRPEEVDIAIQEAISRVNFVRLLFAPPGLESTSIRDLGMADNLDFLLDKVYPGRKAIVWAHNFHITYARSGEDKPVAMGAWVAQRRKPEVYTVGLFMGRGIGAMNNRSLHAIKAPPPDSLEAIMASAGRKMSFVDFSQVKREAGNEWIFKELDAWEWGMNPLKITPARMFDAVIYIDSVTPPKYLETVQNPR